MGTAARAVLRIGWRNVRRNRWRSTLVAALVTLPVAAMVGGMTLVATTTPSQDAWSTYQMGAADMVIDANAPGANLDRLREILPPGARVEPTLQQVGQLQLPGRSMQVLRRSLDLNGLAHGMLTLVGGRLPADASQVAITLPLARVADTEIGDDLVIDGRPPVTVVGYVEDPIDLKTRTILEDPSEALQPAADAWRRWLVSLPPDIDVDDGGPISFDRGITDQQPLFLATRRSDVTVWSGETTLLFLVLGGIALVEAGLVAAAAFAVGIRRRQRELGLLAAAGASRRQLAGSVISEALLLGLIAAALGAVIGLSAAAAFTPWLDELTGKRNGPLTINMLGIAGAASIGVVAALLASLPPAWSAARLPVLVALSGRRPPSSPAHRTLIAGIILVAISVIATSTGATMRLTGTDSGASTILLVGGAIVAVFGFGAAAPWLIELFERFGRRMPLSARIALRDTARARSRHAPAVTAVLASLAATVAFAATAASTDAANAQNWRPSMLPDQLKISGAAAATAGPEAATALGAVASGTLRYAAGADPAETVESAVLIGLSNESPDQYLSLGITDAEGLKAAAAGAAVGALVAGDAVVLLSEESPAERIGINVIGSDEPAAGRQIELRAAAVVLGVEFDGPRVLVSPETAERLGLRADPWAFPIYLIRLGHPVTEADLKVAAESASRYEDTWAFAALGPVSAFDTLRAILLGLSLLVALSVTAVAVALGEAESRPDQRTLLAVGADPAIRRRITAARAAVLALLGGLLAVPAGLIPAWGLLGTRGGTLVVPLPEIVVVIALLPLIGALGALLLSRPIPSWSAFRDITP